MSEKREAVPEPSGLPGRGAADGSVEYYVPDYVLRDFGDAEEAASSMDRAFGRGFDVEPLL